MQFRVLNRRYRLEQRLDGTETEQRFLGFDALLQRPVTITMPNHAATLTDASLLDFRTRYQIASTLHHRNILAVLDLGDQDGVPFLISEYFPADRLRLIIDEEGPFDVDDVAVLIEQVATGLEVAHQTGVFHGSLVPEVIMVSEAGLAKITGFGRDDSDRSRISQPRNDSVSPYQPGSSRSASMPGRAADTYALAAIAYEMLVGIPPQKQGQVDPFALGSVDVIIPPSELDGRIPVRASTIVSRTLADSASGQIVTPREFSRALTAWSTTVPDRRTPGAALPAFAPSSSVTSPAASNPATSAELRTSWPAPPPSAEAWEEPDVTSLHASNGRWFLLSSIAVLLTVAVIYFAMGNDPATARLIPDELDQLFGLARS